MLLEEGVCYEQCVLLAILCEPLPCFILYSKGKFACYSWYLLTSYFFIPVSYDKKDIWDLGSFPLLSLLWILFWFDWPSSFNLFILLGFYLVPSSGIYSSAVSFSLHFCVYSMCYAGCKAVVLASGVCPLMGCCCCCSVTQSCPTFCDPMDCSTPDFPVLHCLPDFAQTHVHWVGDTIQSFHSLFSPCRPAFNLSQYQGLFQWSGSSHQVPKY